MIYFITIINWNYDILYHYHIYFNYISDKLLFKKSIIIIEKFFKTIIIFITCHSFFFIDSILYIIKIKLVYFCIYFFVIRNKKSTNDNFWVKCQSKWLLISCFLFVSINLISDIYIYIYSKLIFTNTDRILKGIE